MRLRSVPPATLLLATLLGASHARSAPKVLDRVVAAVDGHAICASEVLRRAHPSLRSLTPEQRAQAEPVILKKVLEELVDERLVLHDAAALQLGVSPEEVDRGLETVAQAAGVTPKEILERAKRLGASEQEYRDEIRRQLLHAKWIEVRVRPRLTPATSLEAERQRRLEELRREVVVELVP